MRERQETEREVVMMMMIVVVFGVGYYR